MASVEQEVGEVVAGSRCVNGRSELQSWAAGIASSGHTHYPPNQGVLVWCMLDGGLAGCVGDVPQLGENW